MIYLLEQKINAPMFIYSIKYEKNPPNMRGQDTHKKIFYTSNIYIDEHLPIKAIDKLNNINGIIIRSTCEGYDKNRPTHLIFRTENQNEDYINSVVTNLNNNKNIISGYDIGNGGLFRIGVTSKEDLWYEKDQKKINKWWNSLPNIIRNSL